VPFAFTEAPWTWTPEVASKDGPVMVSAVAEPETLSTCSVASACSLLRFSTMSFTLPPSVGLSANAAMFSTPEVTTLTGRKRPVPNRWVRSKP